MTKTTFNPALRMMEIKTILAIRAVCNQPMKLSKALSIVREYTHNSGVELVHLYINITNPNNQFETIRKLFKKSS